MNDKFELTILGSNSAMPAFGRFPTSQIINVSNALLLIDCGEGSQIRMNEYKINRNKICCVLISHLHGDHIYGLPGFLGSLSHLSRKEGITIIGPSGIREYVETTLRLSQSHIDFEIDINEIEFEDKQLVFEQAAFEVFAFPVYHRIPTFGYHIIEKQKALNIKKEAIDKYALSIDEIKLAKKGAPIERNGQLIPNAELTFPRKASRDYAYCADTRYDERLKPHLAGVKNLYFETTYLHELVKQAHARGHSTAREAGLLAHELKVENLIIGHYSSRYRELDRLLVEAKSQFENTHLGYDGFMISF